LPRWQRCQVTDLDLSQFEPQLFGEGNCWAAFDLASTRDMTAFRLLWFKEGIWYTAGRYWVPQAACAQRTERGGVPYRAWVDAGHIVQTEGDVTDYSVIERDILELFERFKPKEIAFDPWNATDLANRLIAAGLPLVQFQQGAKSYQPGMQALERAYIGDRFRFANDPVLTWNAANLVPRRDANMNMAPDRKRSADKIDGMACLLMAFSRATLSVDERSAYEQSELLVI
jgi:phage terminase large subunit-like protein